MTLAAVPAVGEMPLLRRDGSVAAYTALDAGDVATFGAWTWRLSAKGRAVRSERRAGKLVTVYLAREVLGLRPESDARGGIHADHINGDKLDNRRENLRPASHAQNQQNRSSRPGSSSSFRGVNWNKDTQSWKAEARLNGRSHHIGLFDDEREAAAAASVWRAQHMPFAVEGSATA